MLLYLSTRRLKHKCLYFLSIMKLKQYYNFLFASCSTIFVLEVERALTDCVCKPVRNHDHSYLAEVCLFHLTHYGFFLYSRYYFLRGFDNSVKTPSIVFHVKPLDCVSIGCFLLFRMTNRLWTVDSILPPPSSKKSNFKQDFLSLMNQ